MKPLPHWATHDYHAFADAVCFAGIAARTGGCASLWSIPVYEDPEVPPGFIDFVQRDGSRRRIRFQVAV